MINSNWEEEANWIWTTDWTYEDDNKVGSFAYFRKSFKLMDMSYAGMIKVSADSKYRLYINGELVCFGPCKGDRFTWYYETIDISRYLKKGNNVIAVQVLRYPYASYRKGNVSVCSTQFPGLYVHGIITDLDGNVVEKLHTNESWKGTKDSSILIKQGVYTVFLGIMEEVDGEKIPFGWRLPDYDDHNWLKVNSYKFDTSTGDLAPWQLTERPIPLLKQTVKQFAGVTRVLDYNILQQQWSELIHNETVITINSYDKVIVELDAGELRTGFFQLAMTGGSGTKISILCAECYENTPLEEPWIRNKGDRTDCVNGNLYGDYDIYNVAGKGFEEVNQLEIYEPFWFRTFRYIRIEIETGLQPIMFHKINYRETGYPLEIKGIFNCSNDIFSKFWDVSLKTLSRCMHESYEDCPYYEQLQYVMDTRLQILFTYNISGDDRLARKAIYDFHSSILPEGLTQSRYPSTLPQVIPGFSLHWIYMIYDHMMYYGDVEFSRRYLASIDGILEYFNIRLDKRGLVGAMPKKYWSFVDWTEEWRPLRGVPNAAKYGPITVYSLMYVVALRNAADIAMFVGRSGIASEYLERADKINLAVVNYCKSIKYPTLFTDGPGVEELSQHTQIWAVLAKTVEGEKAKNLIDITLINNTLAKCSFAMTFYMFRALAEVGMYHRTFSLWKPWEAMIDNKVTTWMEDTVTQRSDCHGWGALPLYEFEAEILGVQPQLPGYEEIRVHPTIGNLKWAKGQAVTSKGVVKVEWKRDQREFMIKVDGPNGVPVTLFLPDGSRKYFGNVTGTITCKINYEVEY